MSISENYSQNDVTGMTAPQGESRALIATASKLNFIKETWPEHSGELFEALEANRRMWSIVVASIKDGDSPQPIEVQANLVNLVNFIFRHTTETMIHPTSKNIDVLININMELAKGLGGSQGEAL